MFFAHAQLVWSCDSVSDAARDAQRGSTGVFVTLTEKNLCRRFGCFLRSQMKVLELLCSTCKAEVMRGGCRVKSFNTTSGVTVHGFPVIRTDQPSRFWTQVIRESADKKKVVRSRDQRMFKGQFRY